MSLHKDLLYQPVQTGNLNFHHSSSRRPEHSLLSYLQLPLQVLVILCLRAFLVPGAVFILAQKGKPQIALNQSQMGVGG